MNKSGYYLSYFQQSVCLLIIFIALVSCTENESQQSFTLQSPDSKLSVKFWLSDSNQAMYAVMRQNTMVLDSSRLGLIREDADFSANLKLTGASEVSSVKDAYELFKGKRRQRLYEANEQVMHLANANDEPMDIIFRVSDDGVAFRYHFPEKSEGIKKITKELSSFNIGSEAKAWLQPMAVVHTGWEGTNPSYEEYYQKGVATGQPSPLGQGWVYPVLFQKDSTWVLISETGLGRNYCGTHLANQSPDGAYSIAFPQKGEQIAGGALYPESELPWKTPWRIMVVGDLKTIAESTLGTDLADPAIDMDTSFIKPGQASWSWALLKDNSIKYDIQKKFIDYAADMQWEYCLIDINWDTTIGYDRTKQLADYAAQKDVGLLLWYNSSGDWNTTKYHHKSQLLTHEDRIKEFSRLQEMGIKGVKIDFFGGDGQSMINYYIDIFEDAADYELLVNCHGSTLPRGWQRTYPNLMTMEAIKGYEFITFEQKNADEEAAHSATLPFTRNVFDPMDFTPMTLYKIPGIERKTTSAFELALPIIFTSGIQHFAETPEGMSHVPAYVKDFLKDIPVYWEDTKFLDGYPGKLAIFARKGTNGWYIAGINGEDKEKSVNLDLSFLGENAQGTLINDEKEDLSFEQEALTIDADQEVTVDIKGNGGFVMMFPE